MKTAEAEILDGGDLFTQTFAIMTLAITRLPIFLRSEIQKKFTHGFETTFLDAIHLQTTRLEQPTQC